MPEVQQEVARNAGPGPTLFRRQVLLTVGWGLLLFALLFLVVQALWMWQRLGRGAPIIALGLIMEGVVGLGFIIAGSRARRMR